jgi:hypothetical protein
MDHSQIVITFGKYNGKTYGEVLKSDVSYCNWVLKQMNVGKQMQQFQVWLKTKSRKATCECCNGSGMTDIL